MSIPFRSFTEIVNNKNACYVINEMRKSNINKPYEQLLRFFGKYSAKDDLKISDFYGLANCVYGWMPLMLIPKKEFNLIKLKEEWKRARAGFRSELGIQEYKELPKLFNGSIVGLSKMLHFSHPEKFPIYDSNVYEILTGEKSQNYWKDHSSFNNYMKWLDDTNELKDLENKIREVDNFTSLYAK